MIKNIIITSAKTSSWVSCQVISPNLVKAYELCFEKSDYAIFDFNSRQSRYETTELAKSIFDLRPQKIIFVDHAPHPLKLLQSLAYFYDGQEKPILYFHVFGDFTLYVQEWFELEPLLQNFKVCFLAASHRQQALIQSFCENFNHSVLYCPFPVDEKKFYFSSELRKKARLHFNIPKNDFVFTYTGRLSEQKNILTMIRSFHHFLAQTSTDSRLYLAGDFDDLGIPFIGISRSKGFYYQLWRHELSLIPDELKKRIIYLGNLQNAELLELCNASDCYLSLSTHNDEDFGMSPAEALACGCRGLLSNWAGYASFADEKNYVSLVPVDFKKNRINLDYSQLPGQLFKMSAFPQQDAISEQISQHYHERFGIVAISKLLQNYHSREVSFFTAFGRQFKLLEMAFSTSKNAPFRHQTASHNQLYGNIYAPYFRAT